jgi:hypothetical protein
MLRDKTRFPECGMTEVEWFEVDAEGKPCIPYWKTKTPTPCDHSRCQYSEAGERDYLERRRLGNSWDGTPYLRVNGGPGHPFGGAK